MSTTTIIVEPWFIAVGHPAQSLLNTAHVLGADDSFLYLISSNKRIQQFRHHENQLEQIAAVRRFSVPNASLMICTILGLFHAIRIARRQPGVRSIFFLDSELLVIAALAGIARIFAPKVRVISVLALWGPESVLRFPLLKFILKRSLAANYFAMFLRTEELANAWRKALGSSTLPIDTLPSLEIPDSQEVTEHAIPNGALRFGVIGQIRPGKGLETLVPLFTKAPELGVLTVVGSYANERCRAEFGWLAQFPGFNEQYLTEVQLIETAASVDYLVLLYDKWDSRMEAATLFVAARANRPVICFDEGWCGRMVRTFDCGIAVAAKVVDSKLFSSVPARDSTRYEQLLAGIKRFRDAHTAQNRRLEFRSKIQNDSIV